MMPYETVTIVAYCGCKTISLPRQRSHVAGDLRLRSPPSRYKRSGLHPINATISPPSCSPGVHPYLTACMPGCVHSHDTAVSTVRVCICLGSCSRQRNLAPVITVVVSAPQKGSRHGDRGRSRVTVGLLDTYQDGSLVTKRWQMYDAHRSPSPTAQ